MENLPLRALYAPCLVHATPRHRAAPRRAPTPRYAGVQAGQLQAYRGSLVDGKPVSSPATAAASSGAEACGSGAGARPSNKRLKVCVRACGCVPGAQALLLLKGLL